MKPAVILGIESSCDDTAAAVIKNGFLLSNIVASQSVHERYGGVVPELASRAHQQHILPVVDAALREACIEKEHISAIAYTQGPGLLGSLLVGSSFAKGLAQALNIPMIGVNHLQAHVLAHFIRMPDNESKVPSFPFLCLLVSGGNSQIVLVRSALKMEVIGQTIDDAAGEAFDKCAKVMGLPYPGGPHIDRLAKEGNSGAFEFAKPQIAGYDYSFSGLKTSFLYLLRDRIALNPGFVEENMADLCASLQKTIVEVLMKKLIQAAKNYKIKQIALAGGVSANSALRNAFHDASAKYHWDAFIPAFEFTTDNAAMIAMTGYLKYQSDEFSGFNDVPYARVSNLLK
jgi:N6-L-threonylcarbamoyladenine synthase